ncbi:phosphatidylserine/phosphatidylglycerophosphate/cardiolipin synthase family protein [Pasteurella multocida]|uniref:phospholipase D-like domain-containing protein n=1 Tax=Pasteurella multocida TaxID=747 RepID=UPI0032FF9E4C|nr:phosphatidylserine/phosphatidylglycerophosphate/cardiolipin synthase family protein [Pasteurella multocida]HDR1168628.1 phosphatidylserine/phosphatidylglycerophosphate/cardiolipin synthase family protein [Pasteurella multocida]HDR1174895.1 phosphatidylserine/phosphatidylglycerophosphate/cardiolipin synthase family protein [Pasteurella multocida]
MTTFEKVHTRTISQRKQIIPVAWLKNTVKPKTVPHSQQVLMSYSDGRLTQEVVSLIQSAQQNIVICSFLLANQAIEDAVFDASERGIRVYLMLASEHRVEKNSDDEFGKECERQHTSMLKRLAGKVLVRSAPHYHAKAVLIDALSNHHQAKGLLLTANLTTEALERNEELAIKLNFPAIKELADFFKWGFWHQAEHQMLDNTDFSSIASQGNVPHPTKQQALLLTSSQEQTIKAYALHLIQQAKQEIILSSFGFDEEHEVIQALCQQAKRGIKVRVLARIRPSSMNALMKLQKAGAEVYGFKWLHAKALWVDGQQAMMMSANLQKHGLDEGFEVGVKISGSAIDELKAYLDYFINQAGHRLALNLPLGQYQGELKYWENEQFNDVELITQNQVVLPNITADCLSNLNHEATLPNLDWHKEPAHEIHYQWKVIAPLLPKQAKEIFWEEQKTRPVDSETSEKQNGKKSSPQFDIIKHSYQPKVFRENKQEYIAIHTETELKDAIKLRDTKFKQAKIVLAGDK